MQTPADPANSDECRVIGFSVKGEGIYPHPFCSRMTISTSGIPQMATLSIDGIFDACLRIQLFEEHELSVVFSPEGIRVRLPTTRRLADFLDVPHYYVLPYFGMMEQEELVTRAERVGIMTTPAGTARILGMIKERYPAEGAAVLGQTICTELLRRSGL